MNAGIATAARMPIMATTIISSMSVKPFCLSFLRRLFISEYPPWFGASVSSNCRATKFSTGDAAAGALVRVRRRLGDARRRVAARRRHEQAIGDRRAVAIEVANRLGVRRRRATRVRVLEQVRLVDLEVERRPRRVRSPRAVDGVLAVRRRLRLG